MSTYGVGDHMAHYHVNASVPKTLVRHLIEWSADSGGWNPEFTQALRDVIATEISPELIPGESDGQPTQRTEAVLGPYALHDFFLYGILRHGYAPTKLAWLALQSWGLASPHASDRAAPGFVAPADGSAEAGYTLAEIRATLEIFLQRFFSGSQFKRSCIANGPKVGSGGSLSPRGDWRAPSDSDSTVWLADFSGIPKL